MQDVGSTDIYKEAEIAYRTENMVYVASLNFLFTAKTSGNDHKLDAIMSHASRKPYFLAYKLHHYISHTPYRWPFS